MRTFILAGEVSRKSRQIVKNCEGIGRGLMTSQSVILSEGPAGKSAGFRDDAAQTKVQFEPYRRSSTKQKRRCGEAAAFLAFSKDYCCAGCVADGRALRGATSRTLGKCVTWPFAASLMLMPAWSRVTPTARSSSIRDFS